MSMAITSEQLKKARSRSGMSQSEFAERVGVSLRTVGNWERGETVPRNKMPLIEEVLAGYLASEDNRAEILAAVGRLARRRREEIGLSRAAFAEANGLGSITTVQNFESGARLPLTHNLTKFERGLDWEPGAVLKLVNKAGEVDPDEIEMAWLDGGRDEPRTSKQGLDGYTTMQLLDEVGKRVRLAEARWKLIAQGVELPEPSEFRERPDFDLAANDDQTGGDDPDN